MNKKYFIITYGCQMNKSDSERIAAVLNKAGYQEAGHVDQAEIIIFNACSVRQTAMDRIFGKTRRFAKLKIKNKKLKIVVTGCVVEKDKKILEDKVDLIVDIKNISKLPFLLSRKAQSAKLKAQSPRLRTKDIGREVEYFHIKPKYEENFRVFVPIMTGCNNFCSYCVVPYTRGREVSRSLEEIIKEVKALAKNGCKDITLLGQNVNSYKPLKEVKNNKYKHPFAVLLWEVNQIPGIERINFTAPHPKDMADEVIDALTLPKHINYLHLPVQSGDNKILKAMNRQYTKEEYLKLVKKIRAKRPGIALGTDIIVGFPGETKAQFQRTVDLYKAADFDISYHAKYSPRQGTVAAKLEDNVSREEKKRRWQILQDLMVKTTLKKNQAYKNKIVSVLVDKYKDGYCYGNSREFKLVKFKGEKKLVGKIVNVKINQAKEWILLGRALN